VAHVLARSVRIGVLNVQRGIDNILCAIRVTILADICIKVDESGHVGGVGTGEATLSCPLVLLASRLACRRTSIILSNSNDNLILLVASCLFAMHAGLKH